jgi:hypothetical protein
VASRTHRVPARLAWGCALVLGIGLSGCASSQYAGVSDAAGDVHFTVPGSWRPIGAAALAAELQSAVGGSDGAWTAAYEAGSRQEAADFLSFGITQPFVFAEYGTLNATASRQLSDQTLRDFFLPVTSAGRSDAVSKGFPLIGFRSLRDQVLTLGGGVRGVRETFDYTDNRTGNHQADTWDEDVMTDSGHTVVFVLVVHCTIACYGRNQAEIAHLMSSVTTARLAKPTGPFSTLIGR